MDEAGCYFDSRATKVPFDQPWMWLAAGWRDLWAAPAIGFAYGAAFAVAATVVAAALVTFDAHSLLPVLAGGFLLVAPFFAMGLYETSRRLASGRPVKLSDALKAGFHAQGQIGFFGVGLMIAFLVWLQLAFFILVLFLPHEGLPPPSLISPTLNWTAWGLSLLLVGSVIGGVLAALVFALSAVAVPMLLVERVDAITAARASLQAVNVNPKAMALWAALIAALIILGFATMLIGFVVTFPLVGHATWHAYEDIYGSRKSSATRVARVTIDPTSFQS